MSGRLRELLKTEEVLYGVICRDATMTDLELMAQLGYSVVFLDLEHGPQSTAEVLRLGRTITHLGMVPMARIPELTRTQVKRLLDGGMEILTLPDVRSGRPGRPAGSVGQVSALGRARRVEFLGRHGLHAWKRSQACAWRSRPWDFPDGDDRKR